MNYLSLALELKRNKKVFKHLLHGHNREQYLWKPQPDKWCLLEVVCHLYDEECDDFRKRVKSVLNDPATPLVPVAPLEWVVTHKYIEQDYEQKLHSLLEARDESVAWLEALVLPKWDNVYHHPISGPMSASLFLHNWLAHDYHHIRQINSIMHSYLEANSTDTLEYAGKW